MTDFERPADLIHNRGLIADPKAFARAADAASWLFLCGDEFAAVEGGMSYDDVQAAVGESARCWRVPPRTAPRSRAPTSSRRGSRKASPSSRSGARLGFH